MTNQLILGIAVAVVALLIAYELIETWRWQGFANRPPSRFRVVRGVRAALGGFVSIVTLRRWRRPKAEPVLTLTEDDLARRLGDAPPGPIHIQPGRIVVSGARVPPPQPVQPVVPLPPVSAPAPSRLRLARDMIGAALIMGGFVVVFANVMPPISGPGPGPSGGIKAEQATPVPTLEVRTAVPITPEPSPAAIASTDPGVAPFASPYGTGLVSATPTPAATEKPKPATPRPQPTAAPPATTPAPTTKPTPKPTTKPTPKPTAKPEPPVVFFDYAVDGCTASFTNGTVGAVRYEWDFGDGSASDSSKTPAPHTFPGNGSWSVTLSAWNAVDALDSQTRNVDVSCP